MKSYVLILTAYGIMFAVAVSAPKNKAADKWVEQRGVELLAERKADGDSFGMRVLSPTNKKVERTYRLYGVDCPESDAKDPLIKQRIMDQAEWFGCEPEDIPEWGEAAAEFTNKLLKNGKPRVLTRGKMGERAEKAPGRPQRYYAMIEVTAADGRRRWLHELLLEAGFARAFGVPAPWPPVDEDRHGLKEAEKRFKKDLKLLEGQARRKGLGLWKKIPADAGRLN